VNKSQYIPNASQSAAKNEIASLSPSVRASRVRNNPINFAPTLGHRTPHLRSQDIPETRKCLLFAFQILIPALYQLDEFACVDVRVSGGVDVVYDFGRELNARNGRIVTICC
jgi:hypothetical protein